MIESIVGKEIGLDGRLAPTQSERPARCACVDRCPAIFLRHIMAPSVTEPRPSHHPPSNRVDDVAEIETTRI